jgi:hypothetical protein
MRVAAPEAMARLGVVLEIQVPIIEALVDDKTEVRVLYVARGAGNHERVTDHVGREERRAPTPGRAWLFPVIHRTSSS